MKSENRKVYKKIRTTFIDWDQNFEMRQNVVSITMQCLEEQYEVFSKILKILQYNVEENRDQFSTGITSR